MRICPVSADRAVKRDALIQIAASARRRPVQVTEEVAPLKHAVAARIPGTARATAVVCAASEATARSNTHACVFSLISVLRQIGRQPI
jgi:hypothetical protein